MAIFDIAEIITHVGRFLDAESQSQAMKVDSSFHNNISSSTWESIVVDFKTLALYTHLPPQGKMLSWEDLELNKSKIRDVYMTTKIDHKGPYPV